MIAAAAVLAALVLIAFLRIGVTAEYGEADEAGGKNVLKAVASIGPLRYRLYPRKEKKKEERKKEKEDVEKPGRLEELRNQLPVIAKVLKRLRRRLFIKELTIWYMAAGADPASAALLFGGVNAGYGFLVALLENHFRIKKRDFRTSVSFEKTEPYIYVRAKVSLAVWEDAYIAWVLIRGVMQSKSTTSKIRKAV